MCSVRVDVAVESRFVTIYVIVWFCFMLARASRIVEYPIIKWPIASMPVHFP